MSGTMRAIRQQAFPGSGQFPLLGEPPSILGWDVSGMVEGIEPGVPRSQPGDEVPGRA